MTFLLMMKVLAMVVCLSATGRSEISNQCLSCICMYGEQGGSTCPNTIGCNWDVGSLSCGPYQIKDPYWQDSGRPGTDWQSCATNKGCSERSVRGYMRRYAVRCTRGRTPTCEDYARIHNGGPRGCASSYTDGYWSKVKKCCDMYGGCN